MGTLKKVSQKEWNYTLYEDSCGGYVLSVLCGTVGMFMLNIPLSHEEEICLKSDIGLEGLAEKIRLNPENYSQRSIEIKR